MLVEEPSLTRPFEALGEGVLDRLAGPDEVMLDAEAIRPFVKGLAGEALAVVGPDPLRLAVRLDCLVEGASDPCRRLLVAYGRQWGAGRGALVAYEKVEAENIVRGEFGVHQLSLHQAMKDARDAAAVGSAHFRDGFEEHLVVLETHAPC